MQQYIPYTEPLEVGPLDCKLECRDPQYHAQREKAKAHFARAFKVQPRKKPRIYVGPIRVVLFSNQRDEYRRTVWGNSFVIMAYFAIGAVLGAAFAVCVTYRLRYNWHVILFTISTQVLMPAALLTRHIQNGSEYYSKLTDRKYDFFALRILAIIVYVWGLFNSLNNEEMSLIPYRIWTTEEFSFHAFAGVVAGVLMVILDVPSTILCYSFNYKRTASKLAVVLCLPSFLVSVACFILAVIKRSFIQALPTPLALPFIILSVVYYVFLCCFDSIRNMLPLKKKKFYAYQ